MTVLFDLERIEQALHGFRSAFSQVNERLSMQREELTDEMVAHILQAYGFLNEMLEKGMDVFTPAGMHGILELNHLVLCGSDPRVRSDYYAHLSATRKRFLKRIHPIRTYVLKNRKRRRDPHELATVFYSKLLSYPQLFLEGNHRTGNILLNYILSSAGAAPYVPTEADAHIYLNLSGDFKLTERDNSFDTTLKMPKYRKQFQTFLREYGDPGFTRDG
ncbi:MAG: hypothetical protein ACLFUM_05880 [Spirochaetaceae bacterium]